MGLHQLELHGIHHLQNALRGPWTDPIFIFWNNVDTIWFTLLFVAAILCLFNRKEGISLFFIFLISGFVNTLLKGYFHLPRPCHIDPVVGILCSTTFGFPSGAAQTATIIAGVAFAKCRRMGLKIVAAIFALLLCFSRVYLGLHYFTDILGGIGVGLILLWIYLKLFPHVEKHWVKFGFCLSVLIFLGGGPKLLPQAAVTLGFTCGLLFSKQIKVLSTRLGRIVSFLAVVLGSSLPTYLGEIYPFLKLPGALLAGLWFSFLGNQLVSYCCNRLKIL